MYLALEAGAGQRPQNGLGVLFQLDGRPAAGRSAGAAVQAKADVARIGDGVKPLCEVRERALLLSLAPEIPAHAAAIR